jgi:hypothetical protein
VEKNRNKTKIKTRTGLVFAKIKKIKIGYGVQRLGTMYMCEAVEVSELTARV